MGWISGAISAAGSLLGGVLSSAGANSANKANMAFEKEAMQNQIQWKVADAKKAGLHPLAALGMQGYTPSASAINTMSGMVDAMGQGVSRALSQRLTDAQVKSVEENVYNQILEGKRLKAQTFSEYVNAMRTLSEIAVINHTGTLPGMPSISTTKSSSFGFGLLGGSSSEAIPVGMRYTKPEDFYNVNKRKLEKPKGSLYDMMYRR